MGLSISRKYRFYFHEDYQELIDYAIKLGDWMCRQENVSDHGRCIVKEIQDALSRLPEATIDLNAEYGIEVNSISIEEWDGKTMPVPEGVSQFWYVTYTQTQISSSNPKTCPALEIYSSVLPYPEGYYDRLNRDGVELYIQSEAKEPKPSYSELPEYTCAEIKKWGEATSKPEKFYKDDLYFEIEIDKWTPSWQKNSKRNKDSE